MTAESTKGKRKIIRRLCFVVIFGILVVTVILICTYPNSKSIDEQLAAIEAARAIPNSENAAILYCELLENNDATSFDYHPEFLDKNSANVTLIQPWSTKDYPELAAWVKENQWLINELLNVSEFENCRFPIHIDLYSSVQMDLANVIHQWAILLTIAANNDIGEGRIDNAIMKWRCITRMASHLYQQPMVIEWLIGNSLERLATIPLTVFLVEGELDDEHLIKIQSLPLSISDNWTLTTKTIQTIEDLVEEKLREQLGLVGRLKLKILIRKFIGLKYCFDDKTHWTYLRTLARRRLIYILVALRQYRNQNNRWPASLEDIRTQVEPEVLVDPFNKGNFVYKLTESGFTLYSKGENGKDDGGFRSTLSGSNSKLPKSAADDVLLWPVRGAMKSEDTR